MSTFDDPVSLVGAHARSCALCSIDSGIGATCEEGGRLLDAALVWIGVRPGPDAPPAFVRAAAGSTCERCGRLFVEHPHDTEPRALGADGAPVLRILCSGQRVKL